MPPPVVTARSNARVNIPVGCSPLCPSSKLPDSYESGVNLLIHLLARKQLCIFSKTPVFGFFPQDTSDDLTLIVLTCEMLPHEPFLN